LKEFVAQKKGHLSFFETIGVIKLYESVVRSISRLGAKYGNLDVLQCLRSAKITVLHVNGLAQVYQEKCVYNWLSHQINTLWRYVQICRPLRIARYPFSTSLRRMLMQTPNSDPLIYIAYHTASQTNPMNVSLQ
jgi:hypothetical protein